MQIVQTLETINVNTDDISVFQYFKDLITKNFTKVIGRKNKIFSFFEENEIPQRIYIFILYKYYNFVMILLGFIQKMPYGFKL